MSRLSKLIADLEANDAKELAILDEQLNNLKVQKKITKSKMTKQKKLEQLEQMD